MDDLLQAAEKHLDRLKKLLALAASSVNEHETALAAQRATEYLKRNPIPVRWVVPPGTVCHVFPMTALASLALARQLVRAIPAPKNLTFTEDQRVKDQTGNALLAGHLYFQRHGYCVLVPVKYVQAFF